MDGLVAYSTHNLSVQIHKIDAALRNIMFLSTVTANFAQGAS